ncbi:MAG: dihydrofolate reductase family protein [Planctomycetota bacterium]
MKTTLLASVSMDGLIADASGIPSFPETAWPDWCARANAAGDEGGVIAGRASVEQIVEFGMADALTLPHKVVLSSRDEAVADWKPASSPTAALTALASAGVSEAIIGGGRAVYHAFIAAGLIDEVVLDLQPVLFGAGVPLFGEALDLTALELLETISISGDARRMRYRVLRTAE